jgi:2-polyprenyl-6-methoxyphenol hydroxylase-like FAD-dependent oxidoreductase
MTQIIVGAGMAGLLCACLMPHHKPRIVESQGRLPNNHSAVLRDLQV